MPQSCRSHAAGVVLAFLWVWLTAFLSMAPAADAATYATQGCSETAPLWRIVYRLHFSSEDGRTTPRENLPGVVENADAFAQRVGELSKCAVRVRVDVVEDAGVWRGQQPIPRGYDTAFDRYPSTGAEDEPPGSSNLESAVFAGGDDAEPNSMLLLHEWLHVVVNFYETPLGWPFGDVHGACSRPDYKSATAWGSTWPCNVNPAWFSDLMTGNVVEEGQRKGLPPEQWAYQGTPLRRLHRDPSLELDLDQDGTAGPRALMSGRTGPAILSISNSAGKVVRSSDVALVKGRAIKLRLPRLGYGVYRVCLTVRETDEWKAAQACRQLDIAPSSGRLLLFKRAGNGGVLVGARPPLRGRRVSVSFRAAACRSSCGKERKHTLRFRLSAGRVLAPPASMRSGRWSYVFVDVAVDGFTARGVRYPRVRQSIQIR